MARNLTALIVDPNLDSRLEVVKLLEAVGLDSAGESAYGVEATYLAADRRPNIILLALEDPPMRGLSTAESLLQHAPDTPILVYSSSPSPTLMRQAMRAGARDFLEKPLQVRELRTAVHSVLASEEQRQLARWAESSTSHARGTVITVAGAKGGTGKTTIAANLAVALRQLTGQEVAIVDGDAQFGDVAVMMTLDVRRSVADLAREETEINRHTIQPYLSRHDSGVMALSAASEPDDWRALQADHIVDIAQALAETHEWVIIDTPGTMNECVAASLNEAAIVLLVSSLDVSSIKDTKTALRILESWAVGPERVRLIVNDITRAAAVTPEDVERATGKEITRLFAHDAHVGLSVQTGIPLVQSNPRSRFARELIGLTESIAGLTEERAPGFSLARLPLIGRSV
ncbi:MAG: response regulator [Dehalococcoidia bacterium]